MTTEADISAYIASVRYNWYYDNYKRLGSLVQKFYKNNPDGKLNDHLCKSIIDTLLKKTSSYYGGMYDKYYTDLFLSLKQIFSHYTPDNYTLISILEAGCDKKVYNGTEPLFKDNKEIYNAFKVLHDKGINIQGDDIFRKALGSNKYIVDLLSQHQKPTPELLKSAIQNKCPGLVASMLYQKIPLCDNYMLDAVNADSGDVLKVLIDMGGKCTKELFIICCSKSTDPEIFTQALRNKDLVVSKDNFNSIVKRTTTAEQVKHKYRYSYRYSNQLNRLKQNDTAKIIDILVKHGYKITKDDVIFCLEYNSFINNVDNHITLDLSIWEACSKHKYYPYDLKNITPSVKILETECLRQSALKSITQIIKAGTKPNSKCLENACTFKSNVPVVRELITKYKVKPTKQCLINLGKAIGNSTLELLLNALPNEFTYKDEPEDELNEINSLKSKKPVKKIKEKANKKIIKKAAILDESDETDESDCESDITIESDCESDITIESDCESDRAIKSSNCLSHNNNIDVDNIDVDNIDDVEDVEDVEDVDSDDVDSDELVEYDEFNSEIDEKSIKEFSAENTEEDADLQKAIDASMNDLRKQQEELFNYAKQELNITETTIPVKNETTISVKNETTISVKNETTIPVKNKDDIPVKNETIIPVKIKKTKSDKKEKTKSNVFKTKKGQKILIDEEDEDDDIKDIKEVNDTENNKSDNIGNDAVIEGDDMLTKISTVTVSIQKRKKYKPTTQMVRFWTLDKKLELSFLEVRKKFISYITKNKLLDAKNKNMIKVDPLMKDILGLEVNKFFNFSDIDHVVMQFYK